MTATQRTNTGTLFRNDRKTYDVQPDHNGSAEITCPHCGGKSEWWLAAWVKQAKNGGRKFFSLAFTEKEAKSDDEPAF